MSRYTNISTDIWKDPDFRVMPYDAKLLYIYLLTSSDSNIAGMYRLPEEDIERNVGKSALTEFRNGQKFWKYDKRTETILIPNYLKYNTVRSAPQFKALNNAIRSLSWSDLFVDWTYYVIRYCGDNALAYIEKTILRYVITKANQMETQEAFVVRETLKDYSL